MALSKEQLIEAIGDKFNIETKDLFALKQILQSTPDSTIQAAYLYNELKSQEEKSPITEVSSLIRRSLSISKDSELPVQVMSEIAVFYNLSPIKLAERLWEMMDQKEIDLTTNHNWKLVKVIETDK